MSMKKRWKERQRKKERIKSESLRSEKERGS